MTGPGRYTGWYRAPSGDDPGLAFPPQNTSHGHAPIFGELEAGWDHVTHVFTSHVPRHHARTQTTAAVPATVGTTTREEPMSLATDLHSLASRLETLGEEFVTKAEAVAANPATAEALTVLHQLTGLSVPADVISLALGGLKALVQGWGPAPEAAPPAQPEPAPAQ